METVEALVGVGDALAVAARVVHGRGVDIQGHEAPPVGQRLAVGLQQIQVGLAQTLGRILRRAVQAPAQNFRRRQALESQQLREGRIVAVGADGLEVGLAQRQQRDLGREDRAVRNGLDRRPECRAQTRRLQQVGERRESGVAGQQ